jgi:hypothetical protein
LDHKIPSDCMFNCGYQKTTRKESWGSIVTIVHDQMSLNKVSLPISPVHRRAPTTCDRILLNFHTILSHSPHHILHLRLPRCEHDSYTLAAVHSGGSARPLKALRNREATPPAVTQLAIIIGASDEEVASGSCRGSGVGGSRTLRLGCPGHQNRPSPQARTSTVGIG